MSSDHLSQSERCRLSWDYYGPQAEGTATHFQHHLIEWLTREGYVGQCEVSLQSHTLIHWAVNCVVNLTLGEKIYRALKAHRAERMQD